MFIYQALHLFSKTLVQQTDVKYNICTWPEAFAY